MIIIPVGKNMTKQADHLLDEINYKSKVAKQAQVQAEDNNGLSLKEKMISLLHSLFGQIDDIDIEAAIYWFASDWHQGQSSELYSILSTSPYKPGVNERSAQDADGGDNGIVKMCYDELVRYFKNA